MSARPESPVGLGAAHVVADQRAVIEFLADPKTHRASVRQIETPAAIVFLAANDAYKLKRAVAFPFMDFSTLEKRRQACEAEIAVNRPNAPSLYLGTLPVTKSAAGLALHGAGEVLDWVVHMRRFDEALTLDHIADKGGLTERLVDGVREVILASHERADRRDGAIAVASLVTCVEQNGEAFAENPALFPPDRGRQLLRESRIALERLHPLLLARGKAGFVRRCHGDLHLRNIALLEGKPTLFDAIEFDEAVATTDLLYDLAFLLMDLWQRGLRSEANRLLNGYLAATQDRHLDALVALPLFLSIRAAIRAKVTDAAAPHLGAVDQRSATALARSYFDLAVSLLAPDTTRLLAIGGLSGTGKSTLGARLAPRFGRPPGAIHLSSDIVRKQLRQFPAEARLPASAYGEAASGEVYEQLRRNAGRVIKAGQSVIVDAVHARPDERRKVAQTAAELGIGFAGLWLEAPLDVMVARVERRSGDPSDATADVVRTQAGSDLGEIEWTRLDAEQPIEDLDRVASDALGLPSLPIQSAD